jgi:hypothetical protein
MITREELYALVWSLPMTRVAEQFGVSGSYMARVCSVLRVPRPERGYWAKLAVGKAPAPTPLPPPEPGDQQFWSKDGELHAAPVAKPAVPRKRRTPKSTRPLTGTHVLVGGSKALFEKSRPVEAGAYLKPYKRLLVDVTASSSGLDKALAFANDLFNALESAGHRVVLAPPVERFRRPGLDEHEVPKKRKDYYEPRLWSPFRPTVVYVGTVAIGLAVIEMSESVLMRYVKGKYIRDADYAPPKRHVDYTWTTTRDVPCGRLRLIAYSPYWRVSWSETWQETENISLTGDLTRIVGRIESVAVELVNKLEAADRQAEVERLERLAEEKKRRREEDRRQVEKSVMDSKEQLAQIMEAWADVVDTQRFLSGVQGHAEGLDPEEREAVLERLRLAREFVGTQNPLDFFLEWRTPLERYQPLETEEDDFSIDEDSPEE